MSPVTRMLVFDTKQFDRDSLNPQAEAQGVELRYYDFRLDADTVDAVHDAAGVCAFVSDHLPKDVIDALADRGVGLIALRCAGFNNIDLNAAAERGITVTRVPAYSPYAVAEHAVALLLALDRKVSKAHNRVHEWNFSLDGLVGFDLHGKTVGIMGTGKIGQVAAEIFQGFGCNVLIGDKYPNDAWAASRRLEYVEVDELLRRSDIVSLHTPLTPETYHLIDRDRLKEMKSNVIIINVSRGALIDTKALVHALKHRRIGGVALDVYEEEDGVFFEDLSDQIMMDETLVRLMSFPNVMITAHQAFLTREALDEIARVTVTNMRRFLDGEPLLEGTLLGPDGP